VAAHEWINNENSLEEKYIQMEIEIRVGIQPEPGIAKLNARKFAANECQVNIYHNTH
jgi:hypothetical protein